MATPQELHIGILPACPPGILLASPIRPTFIVRGPVGIVGFQVPGAAGAALGAFGE